MPRNPEIRRASIARYQKTEKRRAAVARYNHSAKNKASQKRYRNTPKGGAAKKRSNGSDKMIESQRRYNDKKMASGKSVELCRAWREKFKAEHGESYSAMEYRLGSSPLRSHERSGIQIMNAERVVIMGDIQIPFQDELALGQAIALIEREKPDLVILNGDITDCYILSAFDKNYRHGPELLKQERVEARELLKRIQYHTKRLIWLGGNHEDRWRRLLWGNARRLELLAVIKAFDAEDYSSFIGMKEYDCEWLPYFGFIDVGKLMVTHGTMVRQHSAYTARAHLEKFGKSVIVGHTHRMGSYHRTDRDGPKGAWETGCLCRLDPEYAFFPNWTQGFIVADVSTKTGNFHVTPLPIIYDHNGTSISFEGKRHALTPKTVAPIGTGA